MTFNDDLIEMINIEPLQQDLLTIKDYLRWIYSVFNQSDIFYGHGQDNAWDEAHQIVLSGLHLPYDLPQELYDARLTQNEKQTLIQLLVERLEKRIPTAYLTHSAWFCGLEFYVDERVLIPRSPIGELIRNQFKGLVATEPKRILDLCTGSGCIAIACAMYIPDAEVDALDLSRDALDVAEINIERYQLLDRVIPIQSDLFGEIPHIQYDLIVTNPPYVDQEDIADMPQEFHHEPLLALEAGRDGLLLVRKILAQAADHLTEQGILICEVGNSMLHLIEQYPQVPFNWIEFNQCGDGVFSLSKAQLVEFRHLFQA